MEVAPLWSGEYVIHLERRSDYSMFFSGLWQAFLFCLWGCLWQSWPRQHLHQEGCVYLFIARAEFSPWSLAVLLDLLFVVTSMAKSSLLDCRMYALVSFITFTMT